MKLSTCFKRSLSTLSIENDLLKQVESFTKLSMPRTYLFNRPTNKRFRLNGIIRSDRLPYKANLRRCFSEIMQLSSDQLPPKVDLRPDMTPVEDQSSIGSCSANSLAGAYEYVIKKSTGVDTAVSRLFIYYVGRANSNPSTITDSGCSMTDAIEALESLGTCLESYWPYDIANVNTKPDDQAYQEAQGHKITEAFQVNIDLNEMKTCLAQGFPFVFGIQLYKSFDQAGTTGVVPMPDASDQGRDKDGDHAMVAVGYSDQSNAFIVRNSWGTDWGDQGYCYIPYDYLANSDYAFDMWTVRQLETDYMGYDNWDNDDSVDYQQQADNDDDDDDHQIQQSDDDGDGSDTSDGSQN